MTDEQREAVQRLVRASFAPAPHEPERDLWPDVVRRIQQPPRPSRLDLALVGALIAAVFLSPQHMVLLLWCL